MITEPLFYLVAIPAVLVFGISKGGFGGGLGVVAVPLMSLVVSPLQAAAILLPILCFMDLLSIRLYWRKWSLPESRILLPASLLGILAGSASFEYLSESLVKLIVGLVAVSFAANHYLGAAGDRRSRPLGSAAGATAGAVAGFTSFVAHAGGPPVNMYLLRRPIDKTAFVATTVLFFGIVNLMKLVPYTLLDQFNGANLLTSAALFVPAAAGVGLGAWLHTHVSDRLFHRIIYLLLLVVGLKLTFDGITA